MADFEMVKQMAEELGFSPDNEDTDKELFTITDPESGINSLVVDCEEPILVLEMIVMPFAKGVDAVALMQMNRRMVHGAFVIDDAKEMVIWRDTLQLENLDLNELQGSINALTLTLSENSESLINMSKGGN